MSEFSKATKLYEEVKLFVDRENAGTSSKFEEVEKHQVLLNSTLLPRVEKLVHKTEEVDPITSKPRYGEKHIEKVKTLAGNLVALQEEMEVVMVKAKARKEAEDDEASSKMEEVETETSNVGVLGDEGDVRQQAGIFSLNSTFTYNQRLVDTETTLMQTKEGVQNGGTLDLLKYEKQQLRDIVQFMNKGSESFDVVVRRQQEKLDPFSVSFLDLRDFLTSIITSICAHPEDVNLRRIRASHPVVFKNLTSIEGGAACLLAMGFKVTLETSTAEKTTEVLQFIESYGEKKLDIDLADGSPVSLDLVGWLLHLSHTVAQEAFFHMEEPSIEDTSQWAAWWDSLVAARTTCESL